MFVCDDERLRGASMCWYGVPSVLVYNLKWIWNLEYEKKVYNKVNKIDLAW